MQIVVVLVCLQPFRRTAKPHLNVSLQFLYRIDVAVTVVFRRPIFIA